MGVVAKPTTKNGDKRMKTKNKYVGLDVHKDTMVVAVADGGRDGEVRLYGEISSDLGALEKVLRKLGGEGVTLHVVYEAGPTGFVVYRRLQQFGLECIFGLRSFYEDAGDGRSHRQLLPAQRRRARVAVQALRGHGRRARELWRKHGGDPDRDARLSPTEK